MQSRLFNFALSMCLIFQARLKSLPNVESKANTWNNIVQPDIWLCGTIVFDYILPRSSIIQGHLLDQTVALQRSSSGTQTYYRINAGGYTSWIWTVYQTNEEVLINSIGLDAVLMLRFFKVGVKFFSTLSILGLLVLGPLYYYSNEPNLDGIGGYELEAILIKALSIENMPQQSGYLKAVLAFTWIFSFLAYAFLISFYKSYITLKLQHDEHALENPQQHIDLRSVMVFGVPRDLRNEIDLANYFEGLSIGQVETVVVCRSWTRLQQAVAKRAYYLQKLEHLVAQYGSRQPQSTIRPPNSYNDADIITTEIKSRFADIPFDKRPKHFQSVFSQSVDSVDYYCTQFERYENLVKLLRRDPENSEATNVAFVTFESPTSATIASQSVIHVDPFACLIRMAPEPRDIYWPNISSKTAHSYSKFFRSIAAVLGMLLLVTSSTFVVYSIASLIDLEQLAKVFPWFGKLLKDVPKTIAQLIQGVIPTVLLSAWNAALPSVLLLLCRFQGLEAVSWIESALFSKYFFYLIWNVVLVIPLSSSVIYTIIFNPQEIIEKLGQMLPKSSTTMINYIILQGFLIYPAQLLLAGPLIVNWFTRKFRKTPREFSDSFYPSKLTSINYGIYYPIAVLMFCIGFMYATIAPLILPFCAAFFAVGYFIYKYIFMFVHIPSYETRGSLTPKIVNRCLIGVFIMQLTMMGVLALKSVPPSKEMNVTPQGWSEYAKMVLLMFPLLVCTGLVYSVLGNAYEKHVRNIPFEIIGKNAAKESEEHVLNRKVSFRNTPSQSDTHANPDSELQRRGSIMSTPSSANGETRRRMASRSILDPTSEEPSPFINGDSIHFPRTSSNDYFLVNSEESFLNWAEPPMTRVKGILDPPIISNLDHTDFHTRDCQLHSYLHPALIGKLPIAWLPNEIFEEIRSRQSEDQQTILNRYTFRERLVSEAPIVEAVQVGTIRRFIDGFTSFIHYTLN